jgi:hypothetical protein
MRLDWATLANSAETQGGLLYVMGAGWDTALRGTYPAPFLGAVAMRLFFHPREAQRSHKLVIELVTADGRQLMQPVHHEITVPMPADHPPQQEVPFPLAINLGGLIIPEPGTYALVIFLDDTHLKTFSFTFQPPPQQLNVQPS